MSWHGTRSPARVYEANPDRVRGRCWTSRDWANGQTAEHGGEFIDTVHPASAGSPASSASSLDDSRRPQPCPARDRYFLDGEAAARARCTPATTCSAPAGPDARRIGAFRYDRPGGGPRARRDDGRPVARRASRPPSPAAAGGDRAVHGRGVRPRPRPGSARSAWSRSSAAADSPPTSDSTSAAATTSSLGLADRLPRRHRRPRRPSTGCPQPGRRLPPGVRRRPRRACRRRRPRAPSRPCAAGSGRPGLSNRKLACIRCWGWGPTPSCCSSSSEASPTTASLRPALDGRVLRRACRHLGRLGRGARRVRPAHRLLRRELGASHAGRRRTDGRPAGLGGTLAEVERAVPGLAPVWTDVVARPWVDDPCTRGSYAAFGPGQFTRYWGFVGGAEGKPSSAASTPRSAPRASSRAPSRAAVGRLARFSPGSDAIRSTATW